MLIAAQHLVDRLRHPRSRADELDVLRRRFVRAPKREGSDPRAVEAAVEVRRLREEFARALAGLTSCGTCANGHPMPAGRWSGGHCCSGPSSGVFTDLELAALRLGGTTLASLVPPRGDHAGCSFRGATGCSLDAADRPTICVRYLCMGLEGEITARGDLARIRAIRAALGKAFERFAKLDAERLSRADEELAASDRENSTSRMRRAGT